MSDFTYNVALGSVAEKIRDGAGNLGILFLTAQEAESTQRDRTDLANLLANGNTEATATNYARKTALTGVLTVDHTNNRAEADLADQTFAALGGATNNNIVAMVIFYQESAADSGRIPLTHHDVTIATDGSDVVIVFNASGFWRSTSP